MYVPNITQDRLSIKDFLLFSSNLIYLPSFDFLIIFIEVYIFSHSDSFFSSPLPLLCSIFETRSCNVAQAGLEHTR